MFSGIGITLLLLAIAGFILLSILTPAKLFPESNQYIGRMATMNLIDFSKEIKKLATTENITTPNSDGKYFSIKDYEKRYNVDLTHVFGFTLSEDAKQCPLFTIFTTDGMTKIMSQTPATALLRLTNALDEATLAKLSGYSILEMMSDPLGIMGDFKMGELIFTDPAHANPITRTIAQLHVSDLVDASGRISLKAVTDRVMAMEMLGYVKTEIADASVEGGVKSVWLDKKDVPAPALYETFYDLTLTELMQNGIVMQDVLDNLSVGEAFGTQLPPVLKDVVDMPVSQLPLELENIIMEKFLEFIREMTVPETIITTPVEVTTN
jgi:hypothetical protein